jgi:hypothetical protein
MKVLCPICNEQESRRQERISSDSYITRDSLKERESMKSIVLLSTMGITPGNKKA